MFALGERLKRLREQCGYTQEQLANLIGASKGCIGAYELGMNMPSAHKLYQLAAVLHTTSSYLIDRNATASIDISDLTEEQEAALRQVLRAFKKANITV